MEPLSLIVAALVAGAAAGATDATKEAVVAVYRRLLVAVRARLADRPDGLLTLDRFEEEPATWEPSLRAELAAAGADRDEALMALARQMLAGTAQDGPGPKYRTEFHGQVGSAVVGDSTHVEVTVHKPGPATDRA
ncbi:hypothetical protein SLUN_37800 [Streptomyces lunaelactis]|uniref:RHIM domain-containing protein n=1 Tax=Streptomyces lunaelactis TaxID=1535768 RepID=A0A2R4TD54_9ACTN|nr:hypothetical protein [Streptomyces lunaelactis]AVZ77068.1 hypothetical protein SLUN_37800 [Streptomyces lunaelactis]NUK86278.1 hypothetical protein [Streptomyces lunaelactis]